jgi:hypothetical protein
MQHATSSNRVQDSAEMSTQNPPQSPAIRARTRQMWDARENPVQSLTREENFCEFPIQSKVPSSIVV